MAQSNKSAVVITLETNANGGKKKLHNRDKKASQFAGGGKQFSKK